MHHTSETLEDYLCGELGPERDAIVHAHLEGCADCRGLCDDAAGLRDWLRTAAAAEELPFPSIIKARVWEAVRETQPTWFDRVRAVWRPMFAVPAAAVLALFVYVGVPLVHNANAPAAGVAASYLMEEHAAVASENPLSDRGLIVPASVVDSDSASEQ
jgi:anti-sigma factor RsiW